VRNILIVITSSDGKTEVYRQVTSRLHNDIRMPNGSHGKQFIIKASFLKHVDDEPRFGNEPTFSMPLSTVSITKNLKRKYGKWNASVRKSNGCTRNWTRRNSTEDRKTQTGKVVNIWFAAFLSFQCVTCRLRTTNNPKINIVADIARTIRQDKCIEVATQLQIPESVADKQMAWFLNAGHITR
jgi:hypothetical protein